VAKSPCVIINARRTDTYGRYLADIKYLAASNDPSRKLKDGTYLNGQLLKQRLASRYLP
jgi:endonuclease YncB( thermonuclease family)